MERTRKAVHFHLIALTVFWGIVASIASVLALVVLAFLDAPGRPGLGVLIVIGVLVSFPVSCILAIAISWRLFGKSYEQAAFWVMLTPLVDVLITLALCGWCR